MQCMCVCGSPGCVLGGLIYNDTDLDHGPIQAGIFGALARPKLWAREAPQYHQHRPGGRLTVGLVFANVVRLGEILKVANFR